MKSYNLFFFLILNFFLTNCSKQENEAEVENCNDIFAGLEKPIEGGGTKGWILFSWQEGSTRNYSVVINLNISPADKRISDTNTVSSLECLKCNLDSVNDGFQVFWTSYGSIHIDNKSYDFSYPQEVIVNDLEQYCSQRNIELILDK